MPNGIAAPLESPEVHDLDPVIDEVRSLSSAGRRGDAMALVVSALSRRPDDCELMFARASVLYDWGRIREAREGFLRAEAAGLSRAAIYLNLAWSCHLLRMSGDAERYARIAAKVDPGTADAHYCLGMALQALERHSDAIVSFRRVLEVVPDNADANVGIAHCRIEQHEYADAEAWIRRAIALAPDNPQFWTHLGVAIAKQERYAEALTAFERAEELESARGEPHESSIGRGTALILMGQVQAAAELYRRDLPDLSDPNAHAQYAHALLTLGQFREGWQQFEFRWLEEPHLTNRPIFLQPPWTGQNLAGKTILVRGEQGAGDIIQFARFAVVLGAMGATVVLEVRPELLQLARGFAGVAQVFAPPTRPPHHDYCVHLMGIPRVIGTELATIPGNVPYLRADPTKIEKWMERIEGRGLKVGLAWAGNPLHKRDQYRSVPFERLSPLWGIQGVRYFSLQKQPLASDIASFPPKSVMFDLGPSLEDFSDTAAAIAQLDVVICVDTSVAHLAGALGKPVWLMLPEVGDFRWMLTREDSPWYPTMRLFRQGRLGEWAEVVARVKGALEEAVRTGSLAGPPPAPPATVQLDDFDVGVEATIEADALTEIPTAISRVTEARYGIVQYVPNDDVTARSIAWYGEFLQPHVELLARMIGPDDRLIEVGSGIGAHAIPLARMLGPRGHLFLYETRPILGRILQQNLAANRVSQRTTLMRRAISGAHDNPEDSETLDELLLDRLDLLKIQSEAAADEVLEGASDTLWRLRPKLFISVPDELALADRARQARAYGYRCWRMESSYFNPGNFYRRDADIFGGHRALALLAIPEEVEIGVAPQGCVEWTDASDPRDSAEPGSEPVPVSVDAELVDSHARPGLLRKLSRLIW